LPKSRRRCSCACENGHGVDWNYPDGASEAEHPEVAALWPASLFSFLILPPV
jgi:hypothetical protein